MQIPILNGIYTDPNADFRVAYPRNLIPVPKDNGISKGYLRPADGIVSFGTGPGPDRGAINWNGVCYRVMGTKLISVDSEGAVTILGDVGGGSTQITMDYSFDRLAVASNGNLFYYDLTNGLQQVTDPDLGVVIDFAFIDGYFMTTDGEFLVVTELNDPFSVNPLKYGSSEVDPDPVVGIIEFGNEIYALNRYTIEVFDNVGGDNFPFQRIDGAQMKRGAIGTHAATVFMEAIAFLGSGRNEAPAVYLGLNGQTTKISTSEIDLLLSEYTETQLSSAIAEVRVDRGHNLLYIHLSDQTLVYDGIGSQVAGEPVWFVLTSSITGLGRYRARNLVWCYDRWVVGDPSSSAIGYLAQDVSSHYGEVNGWDFTTMIMYNEGKGAVFNELELIALTGRVPLGADPVIWTQYSLDGQVWSQERPIKAGKQGRRDKRLLWLQQGSMRGIRMQRFRGTSDAHLSMARLEASLEPLYV